MPAISTSNNANGTRFEARVTTGCTWMYRPVEYHRSMNALGRGAKAAATAASTRMATRYIRGFLTATQFQDKPHDQALDLVGDGAVDAIALTDGVANAPFDQASRTERGGKRLAAQIDHDCKRLSCE